MLQLTHRSDIFTAFSDSREATKRSHMVHINMTTAQCSLSRQQSSTTYPTAASPPIPYHTFTSTNDLASIIIYHTTINSMTSNNHGRSERSLSPRLLSDPHGPNFPYDAFVKTTTPLDYSQPTIRIPRGGKQETNFYFRSQGQYGTGEQGNGQTHRSPAATSNHIASGDDKGEKKIAARKTRERQIPDSIPVVPSTDSRQRKTETRLINSLGKAQDEHGPQSEKAQKARKRLADWRTKRDALPRPSPRPVPGYKPHRWPANRRI